MLQITTPNRPDIASAGVLVRGEFLERYNRRGIAVFGIVEYRNGEREARLYDEVPGWTDGDLGGWEAGSRAFQGIVQGAVRWLREELVPPCDPAVA